MSNRKSIALFFKIIIIGAAGIAWIVTKEMGVPALLRSGLLLAVVMAVWAYNPDKNDKSKVKE